MNVMVGICFLEKHKSYDLSSVKTQHFHIFFWFSTDPVIENDSINRYAIVYRALLIQKIFFLCFQTFSNIFSMRYFATVWQINTLCSNRKHVSYTPTYSIQ
jgi:hypothetical protein